MSAASKTATGNFFEDFHVGRVIHHATPRTVTSADAGLYTALTGSRFAVFSADSFAYNVGLPGAPLDDMLVFHMVFGRTVPDISLNAVANLGYAGGRFHKPVYPGDTLTATSEVIGIKENSNGRTGVVYVRSEGRNQDNERVLDYVRWVMVNKRDPASPAPETVVPELPEAVGADRLHLPPGLDAARYDTALAGSPHVWEDYAVGERIDHVDGMTIEDAEHQMATRLYQNTARVHFDGHAQKDHRFGKRIVYGGHVISLARALSFNGLANAFKVVAINGGQHTNPVFGGDTLYAWSEVVNKEEELGRPDVGSVRLRTVATKDHPCADFPDTGDDGKAHPAKVLDFDYTVLMPRRA